MTGKSYQKEAHKFADYSDVVYPVLGLGEEAGEVIGKFAKISRDQEGEITQQNIEDIKKELGDVCWMVAELCTLLDLDLDDVLEANIAKLTSRRERGVIHGSGDNR